MNGPRIVFRCDATTRTGLGHLARCVALAEAVDELGGECIFLGDFEESGRRILASTSASIVGLGNTASDLEAIEKAMAGRRGLVVVDGYDFDAAYLARTAECVQLAVIDDFAALEAYPSSATILNFTVGALASAYPAGPRLLLGPTFFPARRALRDARRRRAPVRNRAEHVLVSIGGVDRLGLVNTVVDALLRASTTCRIQVVAGTRTPALSDAERLLTTSARGAVHVAVPSLAPFLAEADTVVCGGGLTKYEAAFVGLPAGVVSQTDEQARETIEFAARGLALDLGSGAETTAAALIESLAPLLDHAPTRERLVERGAATFPEDSAVRAARALLERCPS